MGQREFLCIINEDALNSVTGHFLHQPGTQTGSSRSGNDAKGSSKVRCQGQFARRVTRCADCKDWEPCDARRFFAGSTVQDHISNSPRLPAARKCCYDVPTSVLPSML